MNKNRLLILFILRLVIFGLFMMSGILKLFPSIVAFEKQLVNLGFVDWCSAPFMARFIIGLELALGLAFLQSNYLKRIIIPVTSLLLVVFCVHLSIELYTNGNESNCGCFGDLLPMSPVQALIKNIITLGILGFMYVIYKEKEKNNILVLVTIFLATNLGLYILYPFCPCNTLSTSSEAGLELTVPKDTVKLMPIDSLKKDSVITAKVAPVVPGKVTKTVVDTVAKIPVVKVDALCPAKKGSDYAQFRKFSDGSVVDLEDGRKIVTLFSLDCEHCMETARKIGELSRKKQLPGTYFLFWGTESQVENFFKVAQCRFPYKIIDPPIFFQLLGAAPAPPKVTFLCNGNIIAEYDNKTFNIDKLEEVISK